MIISCPECGTGYLLPEHLMGPGGARVRCPRCQGQFAVDVRGLPQESAGARADVPVLEPSRQTAGADAPATGRADPLAVARAVLERLSRDQGESIEQARQARRLFADHGPALMEAFEAYRREAGDDAGPGPFREALRERWGVELLPLTATGD